MSAPLLPQLRQTSIAKMATPFPHGAAAASTSLAVGEEEAASAEHCHGSATASSTSLPCCSTSLAAYVHLPAPPPTHRPAKAVSGSPQRFFVGKTAAVFRSKLQRLVWLDQCITVAHSEAHARARVRCIEADGRAALWWQYYNQGQRLQSVEEIPYRFDMLSQVRVEPSRNVAPVSWTDLIHSEEAAERRAIQETAQETLQMLYAAQHTRELRVNMLEVARQQWNAEGVQHGAREVRALELNLAASYFRGIRAFQPDVDDLFDIVEGIHASTPEPPPLAPRPPPARSSDYEAPCEAKIREMYDRRTLMYDEAKERLFLEWWQGAAQLRYVEALTSRRPFALWSYYVRSPLCMRAVVSVQRWWRMLRVASWSSHRRECLRKSLRKLPGFYSAERCRRYLRRLGSPTVPERCRYASSADTVGDALRGLVAAATCEHRYRIQMELYIYTVVQRARALLASRPIQDAAAAILVQASSRPLCTPMRYPLPYDRWRHNRWALYSEAHRLSVKRLECAEASHRQYVKAEEAKHIRCANALYVIFLRGRQALSKLQTHQVALGEQERISRLHIVHQETYECSVLRATVAAKRDPPSSCQIVGPPQRCGVSQSTEQQRSEATASAVDAPVAVPLEEDRMSVGGGGGAPASLGTECDRWAHAERCVLIAQEVLAWAAEESAPSKSLQSDAATGEDNTVVSPEEALSLYSTAFDQIAAAVCQSQYTTLRERYVARYADALVQMRESFEVGLRERGLIIAEEARELMQIYHGDPSAQHVRRFELLQWEAKGRVTLESAQGRVAAALYEALFSSSHLVKWVVGRVERGEASHPAGARKGHRPTLALPRLSPVERFISREGVCRRRIVCDCAAVLSEIIVKRVRLHHEAYFQNWVALCRRDGAALDRLFPKNPPLTQMCTLGADEYDGRLAVCRDEQACMGRILEQLHAHYSAKVLWPDYLFGQLKLTSEAAYMDEQLREDLLMRLANVGRKTSELVQMEKTARGRVVYAEVITRDLRFLLKRLRLG